MQPSILDWSTISQHLDDIDCVGVVAQAFRDYSLGLSVIPPVGELQFEAPRGEAHIKYGYIRGGQYYVVKIASGFYENPVLGLPASQGLMLLFRQSTGQLRCILLDEGRLTDERTGAAGTCDSMPRAPSNPWIGLIGSGTQARQQLKYLKPFTSCRTLRVWSPSKAQLPDS